jgi:hypothetical protein
VVTLSDVAGFLKELAAILGALAVVFGALWWLVGPRVAAGLRELVRGAAAAQEQLDPDATGSTASHAREAAIALQELPALRAAVRELQDADERRSHLRMPERLDAVELLAADNSERIGGLERLIVRSLSDRLTPGREDNRS